MCIRDRYYPWLLLLLGVDLNVNLDALQTEYDGLKATHLSLIHI